MLDHFGEDGTILEGFNSETFDVLAEILQQHPEEAWSLISRCLEPPADSRVYYLTHWLRGRDFFGEEEEGTLPLIPANIVWEWVDNNVEDRAPYLATFVPKTLHREQDRVCWSREVLVRYGDREDVRRNLRSNFSKEGWKGSESLHLREKKQRLIEFKEDEINANVRLWIDEYISELNPRIQRAEISEEREAF
jgi:hypothetical protein